MSLPTWYRAWRQAAEIVNERTVFFVVGCQKSGTTWLRYLLDAHAALCCGGEGNLATILAPLLRQAIGAHNDELKRRSGVPAIDWKGGDFVAATRAFGDRILASYLESKPDPSAVKALGDKTPEHALRIADLRVLYPQALFLHIVRDGRDGVVSGWHHLQRQGRSGKFPSMADYARYFAAEHWVPYITAARHAVADRPQCLHELRYEDLHEQPQRTLAAVLRFLGVDDAEQVVDACLEAASFERLSGGRRRGEEDTRSFFRKGVVGDWRESLDGEAVEAFEAVGGELLDALGYSQAVSAQ